jgi:thiol-disulfide isomerase/thioredoxin
MVRFIRYLRLAALVSICIGIVAGIWALDGALGTGRLLSGAGVGFVMGIGAVLAFIAYAQQRARKAIRLRPPPTESEPSASYDWKVVALDGTTVSMEVAKGELLFLNIWSTMCAPCVAELPSIERLHDAVGNDGVKFMCVATDRDRDRVRRFVESNGLKLPVFVLGDGELPQMFDSDYVPATYVVSPDGLVVYQHTGAASWDHPRVVSFLRGLSVQHGLLRAIGSG